MYMCVYTCVRKRERVRRGKRNEADIREKDRRREKIGTKVCGVERGEERRRRRRREGERRGPGRKTRREKGEDNPLFFAG